MKRIRIAPSIMPVDFSMVGKELDRLLEAGIDLVHLDVMDGNFVPNITFGPKLIEDLRKYTKLEFDTHLMIEYPDRYLREFADAGSDIISVHYESLTHVDRTLGNIKSLGKKVGIALVPSTSESVLDYIMDMLDMIVILAVNPGFGGQKFIYSQLKKIERVRKMIDASGRKIDLEVDGGINQETSRLAKEAGADILVAGTYLCGENARERVDILKSN
ncbi:MAG: ribulose-phosphate 3-epimerase [Rickettsiales bacterium]|jgi:ribulose-phosphate 3-epimerase|nr:ribulose-phosphate 3-epimerase [Rickettsiales bacterium]